MLLKETPRPVVVGRGGLGLRLWVGLFVFIVWVEDRLDGLVIIGDEEWLLVMGLVEGRLLPLFSL